MDCGREGKEAVQKKMTELPLPRSTVALHLKVAPTLNESYVVKVCTALWVNYV